jgi:hypothetical protein
MDYHNASLKDRDVIACKEIKNNGDVRWLFAKITNIENNDTLCIDVYDSTFKVKDDGFDSSHHIIYPSLEKEPCYSGKMRKKRGKEACNGYYRYNVCDYYVYRYDSNKSYTSNVYHSNR